MTARPLALAAGFAVGAWWASRSIREARECGWTLTGDVRAVGGELADYCWGRFARRVVDAGTREGMDAHYRHVYGIPDPDPLRKARDVMTHRPRRGNYGVQGVTSSLEVRLGADGQGTLHGEGGR